MYTFLKLKTLITLFLIIVTLQVHAQSTSDSLYVRRKEDKPKSAWKEKISLGGNFSLQLGNPLYIDLSPLVGYRVTEKFVAGAGVTYIYSRVKYRGLNQTVENSIYGGRGFARHALVVIDNLAAHVEYEALNVQYYDFTDNALHRRWIGSPLVGLAYSIPLGKRSSFNITALYNLNYEKNRGISPYGSPWVFRVGFML